MSSNDEGNENGTAQIEENELDDKENNAETFIRESEECPPETSAQFWLSVAAYEQAPWTTRFQLLEESGVKLPSPESMDEHQLTARLWDVIEGLARLHITSFLARLTI
ncbi:MAG TPA: hypothetical protein VGC91_00910 [Pyrinomonadaceae bacterium]|jgi:hypothetical protein